MTEQKGETLSEGIATILRAFTRPILTIFLTVLWGMLYWNIKSQGGDLGDMDIEFTIFVWGLVGWWFGDRTFLKGESLLGLLRNALKGKA